MRSKVVLEVGQEVNSWKVVDAPLTGKITCQCVCGSIRTAWAYSFQEYKQCSECRVRALSNATISKEQALQKAVRYVYTEYRWYAKSDGRDFSLEFNNEFKALVISNCHYCNRIPSRPIVRGPHTVYVNGIDRVSSDLGYIPGNVLPCCYRCNKMKNDMSYSEFLEHISTVYNNLVGTSGR